MEQHHTRYLLYRAGDYKTELAQNRSKLGGLVMRGTNSASRQNAKMLIKRGFM